jgi:hypothetical protein
MSRAELDQAEAGDSRAEATVGRDAAAQTIGNLTILTQELNSSVSNSPWSTKRPELMRHSLLPINQELTGFESWNEEAIAKRAEDLFKKALKQWPRS